MKLTLVIIQNGNEVLLGVKKRGFGEMYKNGPGGKVEEIDMGTNKKEKITHAAEREVYEETGLSVDNLEEMGVLTFLFVDDPEVREVHVFSTTSFKGEPQETEETIPRWCKIANIPYRHMWPIDKYWLPMLLEGKKFKGWCLFEKKMQDIDTRQGYRIVNMALTETKEL